jgi:glycosyltransferase involved in cell wall biosynthesis
MIFSIVTPSFNQGQFISDTIESVLSQNGEFYIDYIIMDGGSTDNSVEVIKNYENVLKQNCEIKELSGLKYYVNKNKKTQFNNCLGISYRWVSEKDEGQVDALNKGFEIAKGDIFAFMNSDDVYYPNIFTKVAKKNWEKTDFAYGKGNWISEKGNFLLVFPTFKPSKYSFYYQCSLCQPSVFFKRETYLDLGKFDKNLNYVFDYDFWLRGVFKNKKYSFINSFLAKSRMYPINKSLSGQKNVSQEVSQILKKYYSSEKLNKFKLRFARLTINRLTANQVNRLFKIMGHAQ